MSTIDEARVAQKCAEYLRRKKGGFHVEEKPEEEKSEFYKRGEQIAEKIVHEVFAKIEQGDRGNTALSKLARKFHQK